MEVSRSPGGGKPDGGPLMQRDPAAFRQKANYNFVLTGDGGEYVSALIQAIREVEIGK